MSPGPFSLDRSRLDPVLLPIVRAHGAEVMDIELKSEQGGWVLRVFVEKLGSAEKNANTKEAAVDIDTCARIARELSPALDVVEVIAHRYNLEVSTPGVERPLRGEHDFIRFAGEKAKVKLERAVAGQKVLVGILGEPKNGFCPITDGARTFEFPIADVVTARLVFEFPRAEKPGKKGAPNSKRFGPPSAPGSGPASSRNVAAPSSPSSNVAPPPPSSSALPLSEASSSPPASSKRVPR